MRGIGAVVLWVVFEWNRCGEPSQALCASSPGGRAKGAVGIDGGSVKSRFTAKLHRGAESDHEMDGYKKEPCAAGWRKAPLELMVWGIGRWDTGSGLLALQGSRGAPESLRIAIFTSCPAPMGKAYLEP